MAGANPQKNWKFTVVAWHHVLSWTTPLEDENAANWPLDIEDSKKLRRIAKGYVESHINKPGWISGEKLDTTAFKEIGLGWKFRARIIWHIFENASGDHKFEIKDLQSLVVAHDQLMKSGVAPSGFSDKKPAPIRLDYLFDLGYSGSLSMYERSLEALLRYAFDKLIWNINPNLDFSSFVDLCRNTPLTDKDAPSQFKRLLNCGFLAIQSHYKIEGTHNVYSLDRRKPALDNLVRFLRASDYRPVQTVHCKNNRGALTAIADRMYSIGLKYEAKGDGEDTITKTYRLAADERPCLYLRASRKNDERPVTLPQLVAKLKAFYLGRSARARTEPISHSEHLSALKFVRAAMMRTPAIIVFDGHRSPRGRQTALPSLISDDGLSTLLRDLLTPRLGYCDPELDVRTFYKTRIIVLTDDEPFDDASNPIPPLQVHPLQQLERIVVPTPHSDDMVELIEDRDWPNATTLKNFAKNRGTSFVDGATLRLADTWLTVIGHTKRSGRERQAELDKLLGKSSRGLADAINAHLLDRNDSSFLLLRWIALAESELRASTLGRLLTNWRNLQAERRRCNGQSGVAKAAIVTRAEVEKMLEPFESILTSGPDEFLDGLDGDYFPPIERFPIERKTLSPMPAYLRSRSYSFVTNQVCLDFLEFRRDDDVLEAKRLDMYRLLAEEAFRQEASIMRHSPRAAALNVRRYRRMCEGLHYGFASLGEDASNIDQALRGLSRSLPVNPKNTFQRLYLTFFRHVLQHAPDFALTRDLGRPAIASDLIMSAIWSGIRKPPSHRTYKLPPTNSPYLTPVRESDGSDLDSAPLISAPRRKERIDRSPDADALSRNYKPASAGDASGQELDMPAVATVSTLSQRRDSTHHLLVTDIYISLIRNLTNANRLELAQKALEKAKKVWAEMRIEKSGLDALTKVEIDLVLLRTDPSQSTTNVTRVCDAALEAGPKEWRQLRRWVDELLIRLPKFFQSSGSIVNLNDVYDLHQLSKRAFKLAIGRRTHDMNAKEIERGADLFARLGEAAAIHADAMSATNENSSIVPFLYSWAYFHFAQILRDQVFKADPMGREYLPNPHTNRTYIRVNLKLYSHLRRAAKKSHLEIGLKRFRDWKGTNTVSLTPHTCKLYAQFFAYQAQKQLDLVTRFQFQFLSERPSLLMSEASILRTVRDAPEKALELLGKADDLIAGNLDRPRLAFRLALERAKALRQLAKKPGEPERQAVLLIAAATETLRLEALQDRDDEGGHHATGERLWKFVTNQQKGAVKKSIKELRNKRKGELSKDSDDELERLCRMLIT